MKGKKILALLLSATMVVSALTGCGEKEEPQAEAPAVEESVTEEAEAEEPVLEGKIIFGTHRTDMAETTLRAVADEFEALHPGVEIEIESYTDFKQTMSTRLAANELPDISPTVATVLSDELPNYYLPIDDSGFTSENYMFFDLKEGSDGLHYGVSSATTYYGLLYNRAVLEEAGVTEVPTTWDAFFEACKKIEDAGYLAVGTAYRDAWPIINYIREMPVAMTGNTNFINDLATADKFFDEEVEYGIAWGAELLTRIIEEGYAEEELMGGSWDGFKRDFGSNKVGFLFLQELMCQQMVDVGGNPEDIGFAPVPESKGIVATADVAYSIAKNTENPELAKAFFKYLFLDGKFAAALGVPDCSYVAEDKDQFFNDMMATNPEILEMKSQGDAVTEILNTSEIALHTFLQEYVMAEDKQELIDSYNAKWDAAKKN